MYRVWACRFWYNTAAYRCLILNWSKLICVNSRYIYMIYHAFHACMHACSSQMIENCLKLAMRGIVINSYKPASTSSEAVHRCWNDCEAQQQEWEATSMQRLERFTAHRGSRSPLNSVTWNQCLQGKACNIARDCITAYSSNNKALITRALWIKNGTLFEEWYDIWSESRAWVRWNTPWSSTSRRPRHSQVQVSSGDDLIRCLVSDVVESVKASPCAAFTLISGTPWAQALKWLQLVGSVRQPLQSFRSWDATRRSPDWLARSPRPTFTTGTSWTEMGLRMQQRISAKSTSGMRVRILYGGGLRCASPYRHMGSLPNVCMPCMGTAVCKTSQSNCIVTFLVGHPRWCFVWQCFVNFENSDLRWLDESMHTMILRQRMYHTTCMNPHKYHGDTVKVLIPYARVYICMTYMWPCKRVTSAFIEWLRYCRHLSHIWTIVSCVSTMHTAPTLLMYAIIETTEYREHIALCCIGLAPFFFLGRICLRQNQKCVEAAIISNVYCLSRHSVLVLASNSFCNACIQAIFPVIDAMIVISDWEMYINLACDVYLLHKPVLLQYILDVTDHKQAKQVYKLHRTHGLEYKDGWSGKRYQSGHNLSLICWFEFTATSRNSCNIGVHMDWLNLMS